MPPVEYIGALKTPLTITCHSCGHSVTWSTAEARRKLGGECTTPSARRKLWCSACGERRGRCINFGS